MYTVFFFKTGTHSCKCNQCVSERERDVHIYTCAREDSVLSVCVCERERDMDVYIYKCVREENMKSV